MTIWTDYFDWYNLLVNEVAGNEIVFLLLSFGIIAYVCILLKLKNVVVLTMLALWGLCMSAFFSSILPIIVFMIGTFFYWGLAKMIKD